MIEHFSFGLSIYAAIVSTALLLVRIKEYRRTNESVDVSTSFHPGTSTIASVVSLHVTNTSSVPVTIRKLELNVPGPATIALPHGEMIIGGPPLPARIEARSSETWLINSDQLKTTLRENGWNYQVRGIVTLGTGKVKWESIHRYTNVH